MKRAVRQWISRLFTGVPALGRAWGRWTRVDGRSNVPWAPLTRPLDRCRAMLVTTGGVHLATDQPFDMVNPRGDASFRAIPVSTAVEHLRITHDYYDHRDADRDPNIVFPLERFRELVSQRRLDGLTATHFSFMGHIAGDLVGRLENQAIPELLTRLKDQRPDVVLLTPA